jgi:hypothetical protein
MKWLPHVSRCGYEGLYTATAAICGNSFFSYTSPAILFTILPPDMHSNSSLSLNRRLQNPLFESWKLGSDFVQSRSCLQLQGQVYQGASDAVDFLHTKAAVLRNHLIESQGRLFVATNNEQSVVINEVGSNAAGDVQLVPITGEPACCCCLLPNATAAATAAIRGDNVLWHRII